MKITSPTDNPVAVSNSTAATVAKNTTTAATVAKSDSAKSTGSAGVAVTVSTLARSLEAGSGASSDIDTAKVNAMRTAIAQKTYKVNPEVIADRLLSNAQELLKRTRV